MSLKKIITTAAIATTMMIGSSSPVFAQSSGGGTVNNGGNDDTVNTVPVTKKITVNQGDYIQTARAQCTLGYIGDGFAMTAAHCGTKGETVYRNGDFGGRAIGTYDLIDYDQNQDVAIIKLNDSVVGENVYSGDRITSMAEMSKNDELCQYGATTHQVHCGPQYGLPRYGAMWSTNPATNGDSGGPVWIEGKGLIGIISTLPKGGTGITEAWITADKYGVNAPMASHTSNYAGDSGIR